MHVIIIKYTFDSLMNKSHLGVKGIRRKIIQYY